MCVGGGARRCDKQHHFADNSESLRLSFDADSGLRFVLCVVSMCFCAALSLPEVDAIQQN